MLPLRDNVPTRTFPLVTITLIAINAAVWLLYELPDLDHAVREGAFFPCEVNGSCPTVGVTWPIAAVTAMFLHGGWEHIIGNMLFLWIFGNNVEDAMGRFRFIAFYLLGGLAATALQTWVTFHWGAEGASFVPNIGASGAISAVLGAYVLLLPRARVLTLVVWFPLQIPAFYFLGIWIAFQLWQGGFSLVHADSGGGVAFFAHIGGFAFGMLTVFLFTRSRPKQRLWQR